MKEKKVNRVLLYLLGFLCGHSAVVGMHPFMVPMLAGCNFCQNHSLYSGIYRGGAAGLLYSCYLLSPGGDTG